MRLFGSSLREVAQSDVSFTLHANHAIPSLQLSSNIRIIWLLLVRPKNKPV